MPRPKVTIIILNWNGKEDTIDCLESLKHIVYPNYNILLVDNNTTDGSVECFRERYPDIKIINFGFTSAKQKYLQDIPANFNFYFQQLSWELLRRKELRMMARALSVVREIFGNHSRFIYFLKYIFFPYTDLMWTDLYRIYQILLVDYLRYTKTQGIFVARNMISSIKRFKALFIAESHKSSRISIVTIIKGVIYA